MLSFVGLMNSVINRLSLTYEQPLAAPYVTPTFSNGSVMTVFGGVRSGMPLMRSSTLARILELGGMTKSSNAR